MITKTEKRHRRISAAGSAAGIILILLLLHDPGAAAKYAADGLRLCSLTVIPGIFPFMVISGILTGSGTMDAIGRFFEKPFRRLFGVSGSGAGIVLLGAVCGFPVGASAAAELRRHGELSEAEAAHLLCICSYPSPAFLIMTAGAGLWHSRTFGTALYLCVLASGFLYGLITRRRIKNIPAVMCDSVSEAAERVPAGPASAVTSAVSRSALSMVAVCGYITFFSCVTGCIGDFLAAIGTDKLATAALCAFTEMTSGIGALARCASGGSRRAAAVLCAAAAGWSGISVQMQTVSVCDGLHVGEYIFSRAVQSVFCAAFMAAASALFPSLTAPASALSPASGIPAAINSFNKLYPLSFIMASDTFFIIFLIHGARRGKRGKRQLDSQNNF